MAAISILICAYNSGEYIARTIASIQAQTFTDWELLILDNNSTDNTTHCINDISRADSRIHLVASNNNYGPYGGLNKLLDIAKSRYIAICDHDDLWAKNKLVQQVEFLEKNSKYVGCGTNTIMYYESSGEYFSYFLGEKNFYTLHSSLIFRNTKARYPTDTTYFSDAYFQKHELCKGKLLIANLKDPLTLHVIKQNYHNLSYTWFTPNRHSISRIFTIHGYGWYAWSVLFYELFRWCFVRMYIPRVFPVFFGWFDTIPYKITRQKFKKFWENDALMQHYGTYLPSADNTI